MPDQIFRASPLEGLALLREGEILIERKDPFTNLSQLLIVFPILDRDEHEIRHGLEICLFHPPGGYRGGSQPNATGLHRRSRIERY